MDKYVGSPKLAASYINFLHYCLPSSAVYGAGKDNRGRRTDNPCGRHPIWTTGAPASIIPPLNAECPLSHNQFMGQALNNAGLHTRWLGYDEMGVCVCVVMII